jgi:hypothetical protein
MPVVSRIGLVPAATAAAVTVTVEGGPLFTTSETTNTTPPTTPISGPCLTGRHHHIVHHPIPLGPAAPIFLLRLLLLFLLLLVLLVLLLVLLRLPLHPSSFFSMQSRRRSRALADSSQLLVSSHPSLPPVRRSLSSLPPSLPSSLYLHPARTWSVHPSVSRCIDVLSIRRSSIEWRIDQSPEPVLGGAEGAAQLGNDLGRPHGLLVRGGLLVQASL